MEYRHEIISFGQRVPVRCFIHQLGHSGRHWHESLELLFVLSGSVTIIVDGEKYLLDQDDVILINSNSPHELSANRCILVAVQIKLSLFDESLLLDDKLYFDCNSKTSTDREGLLQVKRIVAQFVKAYADSSESRLYRAKALSYSLLSELITYFKTDRSESRQLIARQQNERITRIARYLSEHHRENITLQQIAEQEFLSVPYLSRFFAKMMGMGFSAYLNQVRLTHAVSDLLSTNELIDRIAENNGFSNTQAFVQLFKKQYGVLPSQYRKQKTREGSTPDVVVSNEYTILDTTQYLEYFARYLEKVDEHAYSEQALPDVTTYHEADSARAPVRLRHTWRAFTSVGSAKDLLQAGIQQMLTELQRDVGFTYIKFHGLLSDDMHVCAVAKTGSVVYSFVYVDMALDFLRSVGLRPMIELGFMPSAIALEPQRRIMDSTMINSLPITLDAWCDLVRAFTEHILMRYGADVVEQWPFTVWNEPDTPTTMFGFDSPEDFFRFYCATWKTVRGLDQRIRIGAPSTYYVEQDPSPWLSSFAKFCNREGCRPDFVPFHFYGTVLPTSMEIYKQMDVTMHQMQLTTDETMLNKSIDGELRLIRELYGDGMPGMEHIALPSGASGRHLLQILLSGQEHTGEYGSAGFHGLLGAERPHRGASGTTADLPRRRGAVYLQRHQEARLLRHVAAWQAGRRADRPGRRLVSDKEGQRLSAADVQLQALLRPVRRLRGV